MRTRPVLPDRIGADTFAAKSTELRDRAARLKLQTEVLDHGHDENADVAIKALELFQSLMSKWLTADYAAQRQILEIVCLNWRLDDVTLIPEMRKSFDVLPEGLLSNESRGDRRWTFLNDMMGIGLFQLAIAQVQEFTADTFFALGSAEA